MLLFSRRSFPPVLAAFFLCAACSRLNAQPRKYIAPLRKTLQTQSARPLKASDIFGRWAVPASVRAAEHDLDRALTTKILQAREHSGGNVEAIVLPADWTLPQHRTEWRDKINRLRALGGFSGRQARQAVRRLPSPHREFYGLPVYASTAYAIRDLEPLQPAFFFPAPEHAIGAGAPGLLRGMALRTDGADLRVLLTRGLLVQKAGKFPDQHIIFMTNNLETAAMYAEINFTNPRRRLGLPVIVHIRVENAPDPYSLSYTDIPAEQIYRVSALLSVNGRPEWGAVTLLPDGRFLFRPYYLSPKQRAYYEASTGFGGF